MSSVYTSAIALTISGSALIVSGIGTLIARAFVANTLLIPIGIALLILGLVILGVGIYNFVLYNNIPKKQ